MKDTQRGWWTRLLAWQEPTAQEMAAMERELASHDEPARLTPDQVHHYVRHIPEQQTVVPRRRRRHLVGAIAALLMITPLAFTDARKILVDSSTWFWSLGFSDATELATESDRDPAELLLAAATATIHLGHVVDVFKVIEKGEAGSPMQQRVTEHVRNLRDLLASGEAPVWSRQDGDVLALGKIAADAAAPEGARRAAIDEMFEIGREAVRAIALVKMDEESHRKLRVAVDRLLRDLDS
jgi:hypothetical protein